MARPSTLAPIPTATIHAELRRRQGLAARLASMRDRLRSKVVALDARIADWGGAPNGVARPARRGPGRPRGRAGRRSRNAAPLSDVLAEVLKGRTMSVGEAADAAIGAGYRTKSRHFRVQVNLALLNKARFTRVGRGTYKAR